MLHNIVFRAKLPNPPTPHLLRSNIPPSESEAILVHAVIAEAKAEEQRLILLGRPDAGSASWKMATRHKMGQAAKFIHAHEAITSAIRRIPPEILQEIFFFVSLWYKDPTRNPWLRNLEANTLPSGWALSQVCRSWRASALSLPYLWSHLPAINLTNLKKKTILQLTLLRELLQRSANTLLSVHIFAPHIKVHSHPVIDLLVQHCERWETIIISSTGRTIAGIQGISGRLPSLKAVELVISSSRNADNYPADIFQFEVAPQLRSAHVTGAYLGEVVFPFRRLVHYRDELGPMFQITQLCDSGILETLTLLEIRVSHFDFSKVISLPHLVKLDFKTYHSAETSVLQCFSFPEIEDLHIVSCHSAGYPLQNLTSTISRSRLPCPLKSLFLRMKFGTVEPGALTTLLKLTPELVELNITKPQDGDISDLVCVEEDRPLVPRLESCIFEVENKIYAQTARIISSLASSRCEVGDDSRETEFRIPGELRRLKRLRIVYHASAIIVQHGAKEVSIPTVDQAPFENWTPSKTSLELGRLKYPLCWEIPTSSLGQIGLPRRNGSKWPNMICDILNDIESVEITDARDILMSGLHFFLRRFEEAPLKPNVKERFLHYTRRIQEKWKTLIEQCPSEQLQDIHWALDHDEASHQCLTYIDRNHAARTSPEVFSKSLIYGVDYRLRAS
ncbi:hypothetical protein BDZ97DRAFT_1918112 [Flammula alnicola]|nr:hypothetical protein BDZ97DRAFT_1918112 [Flammula alnicola]